MTDIIRRLKEINKDFKQDILNIPATNTKINLDEEIAALCEEFSKDLPLKENKVATAQIPTFYQKLPGEEDSLQQKVREEARALLLQRKSAELLNNEELQALWYLLDSHRTPALDALGESSSALSYEDFMRAKEVANPKCRHFFTATNFIRLSRNNPCRILLNDFFSYVMKTTWLHQTRIGLSLYDVNGQGYLKEMDLENYIMELIPTLPQLDRLEKSFHPFYVCTAVRKFFFFLDPMRTNRVKIVDILASSFLDDLLELRDGSAADADDDEDDTDDDDDAEFGAPVASSGVESSSLNSLDLAGTSRNAESGGRQNANLKKSAAKNEKRARRMSALANNWFSAQNALRVYGTYLHLDKDQNGMLSRLELSKFMNGSLTGVFLDRVFQECLTFEGEMDYKGYLDFVLALENKREPQALQYLFRILDVEGQGYLTPWTLNYFYRSIRQSLLEQNLSAPSLSDIQDEIFDLVKPKHPHRITLDDLIRCGQGDTVVVMLTDLHGFWNFETSDGVRAAGPPNMNAAAEEADI